MTRKCGRNSDGTFGPGNPGKPTGSRHRATQAVLALLDGEAEALGRKAVELALGGDTTALRLVLERIVPPRKDTPIVFELPPMKSAANAAETMAAVLSAVAQGNLTPAEGSALAGLVEAYRKALESSELEARVTALEAENARPR